VPKLPKVDCSIVSLDSFDDKLHLIKAQLATNIASNAHSQQVKSWRERLVWTPPRLCPNWAMHHWLPSQAYFASANFDAVFK
jgi:hypothetical protein